MKLSVIIVNWNTRDLLETCLRSVYKHFPAFDTEVIVVDNASADDSVAMVQRSFPGVRLTCNARNVGFAGANNQGIEECSGEYVLLLNSDTEVFAGAIDELVRFLDEHPTAGGAGSHLLNADGSLQESCYPFPTIGRELWRLFHLDAFHPVGVYPMERWDTHTPREVDYIKGASLLLRKKALDQVGYLDTDYFMYSEELDLCYRLRNAGWKNYWVPQSKVVHYGGQSTKQVAEKMFLELYRSKVTFFRKNQPQKTLLYKLTLAAASVSRILLAPLCLLESAEKRKAHITLARYYSRLIRVIPSM